MASLANKLQPHICIVYSQIMPLSIKDINALILFRVGYTLVVMFIFIKLTTLFHIWSKRLDI